MSYSISDTDSETTIIAPRFNDEASRSAAPVVPLTSQTTNTFTPVGQKRRQSWSIAAIFLATLIGGAAAGFALDLYLRNQNAQQLNQAAQTASGAPSVNSLAEEETKPLIVAAPTESVEGEIPVANGSSEAANKDNATEKDDETSEVNNEDDADEPEPVRQIVPAPHNSQSEKNQYSHPPVLKQHSSSTTEENQNKEVKVNDNTQKIENSQETESHQTPAPETDAAGQINSETDSPTNGQINRVREIFEGRPRRVARKTSSPQGNIDRVREIFEGRSTN